MTKSVTILLVLFFLTAAYIISGKPALSSVTVAEDSWVSKAPMQVARAGLGVAVVDGKIYAIGGSAESGVAGTNEEYDPVSDMWTFKTPMPTGRSSFATAVYQNRIYCIGGENGYLSFTGLNEVYDPSTDTWETKTSMPTPRKGLEANMVKGKIYLIGGIRNPNTGEISNLNEVYDPATDTWTTKAPIPTALYHQTSAVIDDKIYVIGTSSGSNLNQIYDPETDTWSSDAPPPPPVGAAATGATVGVMAPKRIYVIAAGEDDNGTYNINHVYNPEDGSWTVGASMPTTRFSFAVAVVEDRLYAIGGVPLLFAASPVYNAENEEYTPIGYAGPAEPSPSPSPTASPSNTELEPFTATLIAVAVVSVAAVTAGLLVYFKKHKR